MLLQILQSCSWVIKAICGIYEQSRLMTLKTSLVLYIFIIQYCSIDIKLAENGLSFIETSALDATNVELAFQKILTGKFCYSAC